MQEEYNYEPLYKDERIMISGITGLDMRALWDETCAMTEISFMEDRHGKTGGIEGIARGHREGGTAMYHFMFSYVSTQGVFMQDNGDGNGAMVIPWLASPWDVRLAYTLLRQIRAQRPSAVIIREGEKEDMDLSEEAEEVCARHRKTNIRQMVSEAPAGCHIPVVGCNHIIYMPSKADWPDLSEEDFVEWSTLHLLHAQWGLTDLKDCARISISDEEGDDEALLIDNDSDVWVEDCARLGIVNKDNDIKVVDATDFIDRVAKDIHFVAIDLVQFGLRKMPDDLWENLWKSFDAPASHLPRTWLLRWNPAISSFKMADYERLHGVDPDMVCMNWSFFFHEGLQPGDRYFMERVGEGDTGLVFRGTVCSEAYKSSDWAGTDRKRYYADLTVEEMASQAKPVVTTEQLRKALPGFEWGHGHSGVPLTNTQAANVNSLWHEGYGKTEGYNKQD